MKRLRLIAAGALLGLSLGGSQLAEAAFKKISPAACVPFVSTDDNSGLGFSGEKGMYESNLIGGGDLYCPISKDGFLSDYEATSVVVHVNDGDPGSLTSDRFNIKACNALDNAVSGTCGTASSNSTDGFTSITVSDLSNWNAGTTHGYLFIEFPDDQAPSPENAVKAIVLSN